MAANSEREAEPWKHSLSLDIGTGRREANGAEEDEPLSPIGPVFHYPGMRCFIVATMGFAKPLDAASVKTGIAAMLARHPRFSSVPVLDDVGGGKKPRWVPTKVAVEDHIFIPNLHDSSESGCGGFRSPDRVVEDYIASLTATPMDAVRPLWELHILNIRTSEAAAAAVLRLHHSLGDGTSLISLLLACTRKVPDPSALPAAPRSLRPPVRPWAAQHKQRSTFKLLLLRIWVFLVVARNTVTSLAAIIATALFLRDTSKPIYGSEGVSLRPKRIVHRTVSLDDIRDVKKAMSCTVNDVLVGVTSAALSRYLRRRCDDKKKQQQLPSNSIRLRSILMVNNRPKGIYDLAELMEEGRDGRKMWGNLIGFMIVPFHVGEQLEDPLDYVRRAKRTMDRKKNSLEGLITFRAASPATKYLGNNVVAAFLKRVVRNTTFTFSNMVGPTEQLAVGDNPIVYLAPSVYGHPHALTLHFQSYMNIMKIVATADEEEIPDPHQLLDDMAHSLDLIKGAI